MIQTFASALRSQGDLTVIDLSGVINGLADQELNAIYDQAEASGARTIALNFSRVDYINSTGIALLVGLVARTMKAGRKIVAFGLSEHYLEIFQITRLADFIKVYSDEASLLAELNAGGD